jgi:sigma-B regulation protein RsbU (phosphoserine phosphatase)
LTCANAGHPPGYVLDQSGLVKAQLGSTAIPLGIDASIRFDLCEPVLMQPGDAAIFCTDGLLEARSSDGQFFGADRMLEMLRNHQHQSAHEIIDALIVGLRSFTAAEKPADDVTIVVVKRRS